MVEKLRPPSVAPSMPDAAYRPLIVIPCLNEVDHIARILRQLEAPAERLNARVRVVDGGSTDGTREIVRTFTARNPRVELLHNPDKVQSAGVNLAVACDNGASTHLIRLDAHSGYPDNYCDVLMTQARSVYADAIVVSMVAQGDTFVQRVNAAVQNSSIGNGGARHRIAPSPQYVDHGHHALIRINAFRKVGGYDRSFTHNEDAELDHRVRQAGGRIWLTSSAAIRYFPRASLRAIARQYFNFGSGRARNLLKHNMMPQLRQAKVISVVPALVLAGFAIAHWALALPAVIWLCACGLAGLGIAIRHRHPALAVSALVAMLMHLTWSLGFWQQVVRGVLAPSKRGTV